MFLSPPYLCTDLSLDLSHSVFYNYLLLYFLCIFRVLTNIILYTEINICSNSSTYDSSEDAAVGTLSETEYMRTPSAHELGTYKHVQLETFAIFHF